MDKFMEIEMGPNKSQYIKWLLKMKFDFHIWILIYLNNELLN